MRNSDNGQSTNGNKPSDGLYKFLENEIKFERARKQEVFSWASSLLVALIGGVITLTTVRRAMLVEEYKWFLSAAISILGGCSCFWIELHWREYLRARKKLSFYYDQIATNGKDSPWKHDYTSIAAVLSLSIVALISVWWPIPCYPAQ
jgi:hypothetical protein